MQYKYYLDKAEIDVTEVGSTNNGVEYSFTCGLTGAFYGSIFCKQTEQAVYLITAGEDFSIFTQLPFFVYADNLNRALTIAYLQCCESEVTHWLELRSSLELEFEND